MALVVTTLLLPAADQTELLGNALARALPLADGFGGVLHLQGELGAGKTTCVRSLLRALGVTGLVRSPTYTLVETYAAAALTCVHIDLYRLADPSEAEGLGLRDQAGPGSLVMVEWAEKGGAAVPRADVKMTLAYAGDGRLACLSAVTATGTGWLRQLGDDTRLTPYVSNIT